MGGAHSTAYNTPTAVYYNPASIAFLSNFGFSINTIPFWLPSLTDDISFQGFNFAIKIPNLGNVGVSYTNFDFEEAVAPNNRSSYMRSYSVSTGKLLSVNSAFGISLKRIEQLFAQSDMETPQVKSVNYAVDIGYQKLNIFPFLTPTFDIPFNPLNKLFQFDEENRQGLSLGISISNIGPAIKFPGIDQRDPLPQNLRVGISWNILNTNLIDIKIAHDRSKLILRSYPDRDLNDDGVIMGDDDNAHIDPWYKAYFTTWEKDGPPWTKKYGGEIKILGIIHLWLGIIQSPFILDTNGNILNLNSKGIGIGTEGFRFSYTTLRTVRKHSIIDALKDPGVFDAVDYDHPQNGTKAFTLSFMF